MFSTTQSTERFVTKDLAVNDGNNCIKLTQVAKLQQFQDTASRGLIQQREIRLTQISIAIVAGKTDDVPRQIVDLIKPPQFYFQYSFCVTR